MTSSIQAPTVDTVEGILGRHGYTPVDVNQTRDGYDITDLADGVVLVRYYALAGGQYAPHHERYMLERFEDVLDGYGWKADYDGTWNAVIVRAREEQ